MLNLYNPKNKENPILSLFCNILIPVIILKNGNKWINKFLIKYHGEEWAYQNTTIVDISSIVFFIALICPVIYFFYDLLNRKNINLISILGFINILLTGGIGIFGAKFGLSKKTGIDLPYEAKGIIHKLYQYRAGEDKNEDNIYKTTDSYGQGITATFIQVLKAYSAFNNDGKIVTPYIVRKNSEDEYVISKDVANRMKRLLVKTVEKGTGRKTFIEGLEIGGKTGTANVVENGKYQRKYMSSFFGFVNDENKKYTIGVTVNDPVNRGKKWYYYYASNSAVPVFKEITKILLKLNYLELKTK